MLGVLIAAVALTVYLYVVVPKGFFPQQDTGMLSGITEASQDISFAAMSALLVDAIILVPVGVVTAIMGAPFFLVLLRRSQSGYEL